MGQALGTLAVLAVMVEFLTEALRENIPVLRRPPAGWVAIVLGILLCWLADIGLLQMLGDYHRSPYFDYAVTGLVISRGSSVMHSLISALKELSLRVSARSPQG